jgi:hypothetical protein
MSVPNVRAKALAAVATAATSAAHRLSEHAWEGRHIYFNADRTGRMQL